MATFEQCQKEYDAQTPDDPNECEDFGHTWKFIRGNDEVALYRCSVCGEEELM